MPDRYRATFDRLRSEEACALVPFVVLGDPDLAASWQVLQLLLEQGIDAIELGVPFSDPVADGPVLQAAATRALASGTRVDECLDLVCAARALAPQLPIGLLAYANTAVHRGIERFYRDVALAGADSVLLADVPLVESAPFEVAARGAGVLPVLIAPPGASPRVLEEVARRGGGYTYVTSRAGVTGNQGRPGDGVEERIRMLRSFGAPPPVVGFGVASVRHVVEARRAGADGVIVGSSLVRRLQEAPGEVPGYLRELREATRSVVAGANGGEGR